MTYPERVFEGLRSLAADARYALRLLLKSPVYSAVVVAVLALGIAVNLLTFGLFQALVLTPIGGVPQSSELRFLSARTTSGRDVALPYRDYEYVRDHGHSFERLAGSYVQGWMLGRGSKATMVFGELVTGNYFDVLGAHMQRGRAIGPDDNRLRGGHPVAVISDALWRSRLGAMPDVIGRTIELDRTPLTVIGVAGPEFHGAVAGLASDVFVPYMMEGTLSGGVDRLDDPRIGIVFAFGRPQPGVALARARAEADSLGDVLARVRPLDGFSERLVVSPIWQAPQGAQTYVLPAVSLLSVMSAVLLLVVCLNVAGLVLVRSLGRTREIAARLAFGAGRGRIVRLLMIETMILAIPGGLIGYYLPRIAVPYLEAAQPTITTLPLNFTAGNAGGSPMLIAAIILVVASVVLAGIGPALRASRVNLTMPLRQESSPYSARRSDLRHLLVVAQVALSLLLLVATALVTRSLTNARHADAGFSREVASVTVDLLSANYDEDRARAFYRTLLESLRSDPAIQDASLMKDPLLMLVDLNTQEFIPEGRTRRRDDDFSFLFNVVATDHFRTLGIPLLAGRDFAARDDQSAPPAVIINETFARRFWGTPAAAIGRRLQTKAWARDTFEWRTIVGVAGDIKYARLTEPPRPYVYLPHAQNFNGMMSVQARGSGPPAAAIEALRRHLVALDPDLPMMQVGTLGELTSLGVGIYDVTARALAIVGAAATMLMALGIFGLVAYTVQQSTKDTGIRLAVGAPRTRIVGRFVTRAMILTVVGVTVGFSAALAATRLMSGVLYGVSATDGMSFLTASAGVIATALAASFLPAWRGSRVDPLVALRRE